MTQVKIPDPNTLVDQQIVNVEGPDGIITTYVYDLETRCLTYKDSQIIIPPFHGQTHVTSDPVPDATEDLHGLMSSDDKAKLDALLQMRLGVLGFMGSGFPDDQGWLQGDIILAAGTEFINLERVGNVIRFTVDSSIPLCSCEECAQIFWIQDESDIASIRPPSCGGKLPGANVYGEFKVFLLPETTIFDPANPLATLNKKNRYPAVIFKRSTDQLVPGQAEWETILRRRSNGTTSVGWVMTPGPTRARAVWFMGEDSDGNDIRFEFELKSEPGILGALLYKGHTLTRRMAVITSYAPSVLATNQYNVKYWDILKAEPVGSSFVSTNIWKYQNPENSPTALVNPRQLVLDGTQDILPIGTLVQLWEFKIAEVSGQAVLKRFFNLEPNLGAETLWGLTGAVRFGDLLTARKELEFGSEPQSGVRTDILDACLFERTIWGITGFEDPLLLSDDLDSGSGEILEPSGVQINNQYEADIDPALPGLKVVENVPSVEKMERPIFLWHRINHRNFYTRTLIGQPESSRFPPIDILLKSPVDSVDDVYMKIIRRGIISSGPYINKRFIIAKGAQWKQLPADGAIRVLTGSFRDRVWNYFAKTNFSNYDDDGVMLIGTDMFPFSEDATGSVGDEIGSGSGGSTVDEVPLHTTVVELLHLDFTSPAVRLEFSVNTTSGDETVQLQFKSGTLDMSQPYELNLSGDNRDDLVRGFKQGYYVSGIYTQSGFIHSNETPASNPEGFKCYWGGFLPYEIDGQTERWNVLETMVRDNQLWIWWNNLLIPPSTIESAKLPTPVVVNTPYFPFSSPLDVGKLGLRLWPQAKIRSVEVRDQILRYNEFAHGQLELR
jgi:hypothetical protein